MDVHRPSRWIAAALGLAAAAPALGQTAFDQLCAAAGGNCNVNVPAPPPPTPVDRNDPAARAAQQQAQQQARAPKPRPLTMEQQLQVQLVGGLLEGLLSSIFDGGAQDAAAQAAAAERQRQEAALLQQRIAAVQQQRAARDQENARSMNDLSAALADDFVGVVQPFAPPPNPFARPAAPPSAHAAAAARLAQLAAENGDVAVLASRLGTLEDRLAALRAEAVALKRDLNGTARELGFWGDKVQGAVDDAWERGLSMATEGLFSLEGKGLARLGEVQSNGRAWNRLTGMLKEVDGAARGVKEASELVTERLDDARWALGKRDTLEDLKFVGSKVGGKYWEAGASIATSAQSIRTELQAWKAIDQGNARVALAPEQLARIRADYDALLKDVKAARGAVSAATGIDAQDLVRGAPPPQRPTSLGSYVPHPDD